MVSSSHLLSGLQKTQKPGWIFQEFPLYLVFSAGKRRSPPPVDDLSKGSSLSALLRFFPRLAVANVDINASGHVRLDDFSTSLLAGCSQRALDEREEVGLGGFIAIDCF